MDPTANNSNAGEVASEDALIPPSLKCQRITAEAAQVEQLGLSRRRIARQFGVAEWTVVRALEWFDQVK